MTTDDINGIQVGLKKVDLVSIKKKLKKVKNAGQNTEVLGWLIIALVPLVIWVKNFDRYQATGYFIVAIMLGLYFIYTGKYVHYARGKHIGGLLLFNGFFLLLLTPGLLPLVVAIESFVNSGRYSKLKSKFSPKFKKHSSMHISKAQIIIFILLIIGNITLLIFKYHSSATASNAQQQNYPSISKQSTTFSATDSLFSINFPGHPTTSTSSGQTSGYTIPITTYDSQLDNGSQEYDIYVYNWPTQGFDFTNISNSDLKTSIQSTSTNLVQAIKGKTVNNNFSSYLGHTSIDTQFTTQLSGNTFTGYLRVFFIGNYEYGLLSLGSSQGDFNSFANSFQYTGS